MPQKATATKSAKKPTTPARPRTSRRRRTPNHEEISRRAYFIHLEEGCHDELGNWLRAERELTGA